MGQSKEDGAAWSQLLNKANGRLQYDLEIIVKSNGESDFPLFGTKHAGVDAITYTGQKCLKIKHQQIKQFKDKQKSMQQIKAAANNKSIKRAQLVFFGGKNRRKMINFIGECVDQSHDGKGIVKI